MRSNRGGKRKNAGRKKGSKNKRSLRITDLAREYTDEALETLIFHMRNKRKTPDLSLRASETLIAYAYGKPFQMENPDAKNEGDGTTVLVIKGGLPD